MEGVRREWRLAGTMQSNRGIQNVEFRIQRKDHANRGDADLKNLLPTALTIPWLTSFFWILDAGFLDSTAFFRLADTGRPSFYDDTFRFPAPLTPDSSNS